MSQMEKARCLIMNDGSLLLIKRTDSKLWELPGGIIPEGEEPEVFAAKITGEQTGIEVSVLQQFNLYEMQDEGKNFDEHVYESVVKDDSNKGAGEGISAVEWISMKKLKDSEASDTLKQVVEEIK